MSWRIIKDNLETIYNYILNNNKDVDCISVQEILGAKGTSYRQWSNILKDYPLTDNKELSYWNKIGNEIQDYNNTLMQYWDEKKTNITFELEKIWTNLLIDSKLHKSYNTTINQVLLTALGYSLYEIFNIPQNYVTLEGHGREYVKNNQDISSTIGWFTDMFPFKIESSENILDTLINTKDSTSLIPSKGIGYGAFMGYSKLYLPLISFNYLGIIDQDSTKSGSWKIIEGIIGEAISNLNSNTNLLNINCFISEKKLSFHFDGNLEKEIQLNFGSILITNLKRIIDKLTKANRTYLTQSDINWIVSKESLNKLQENNVISDILYANSLQQGFIYHYLNKRNKDDAYCVQIRLKYNSLINIEYLKRAWEIAITEFPALRLSFSWDEEIIQIINKFSTLDWRYYDISDYNESESESYISTLINNDRKEEFQLEKAPLFRVYLIKTKENYNSIFSIHHAILDGWSNGVLLNAVHKHYLNLIGDEDIKIVEDRTYILAQSYLQDNVNKNKEYWKDYISQIDDIEDLKGLYKKESNHINLNEIKSIKNIEEKILNINETDYNEITKICGKHGITINSILQYCWHKTLNVYGNVDKTIIGMVVSGRNLPINRIEKTVGLFINTLPVIVDHNSGNSILEKIKNLQNQINETNERSVINLSDIHNNDNRLFNSIFVFENYPYSDEVLKSDNLNLEIFDSKEKTDYPLSITISELGKSIRIKLQFASDIFDTNSMEKLLSTYSIILSQIVNGKDKVRDLDFISDTDFELIVNQWNNNKFNFDESCCIQNLFEKQVLNNPDNVAIKCNDKKITYNELNGKANQLANCLINKYNVKPGDNIGVYLHRSEKIIIAILAILKTGSSYVPLDVTSPLERTKLIIDNLSNPLILIDNDSSKDFVESILLPNNYLNLDDKSIYQLFNLKCEFTINNNSDSIAYIIHTSGTTGVPKGVKIKHYSFISQIIYFKEKLFSDLDQINTISISNYVFDVFGLEYALPLFTGGFIEISDSAVQEIDASKYSFIQCTPNLLAAKFEQIIFNNSNLQILVGGESITPDLMDKVLSQNIKCLVNVYGPTETTIWATMNINTKNNHNTLIGKPIGNTSAYILNKSLKPMPIGAIGELYIGGIGVGSYYDETLTQQKFLPHPFLYLQNENTYFSDKIYSTGDLARYQSDGNIEFIGRNDFQVKIRGFRIELDEINNALNSINDIHQGVVIAYKHQTGINYLVAYYVSDKKINETTIVKSLSKTLPSYMIPSTFIHLEQMPLNVNGKVDRKKLPMPELNQSNSSFIAPKNSIEVKICDIYSDLLFIEASTISTNDDFFKLGGNSILAIKLSNRISKMYETDLKIADIFKLKTISNIASFIQNNKRTNLKIVKQDFTSPLQQHLSFAQERLWFIHSYEKKSYAYNIPLLYKLNCNTNVDKIKNSIERIIENHESLRTCIKTDKDGNTYQEILNIPFRINEEYISDKNELIKKISDDTTYIFDLTNTYPINIKIYHFNESIYLGIVVHHIAFDGWSIDIFINELISNYQNDTKELLPNNIQYKDYAFWQKKYLTDKIIEDQFNYWKNELDNYEELNLPLDNKRPQLYNYEGRDISFIIDKSIYDNIQQIGKELNVSLFSILLANYYLLLSCYSGQEDIVIGSPIANRHISGTEDIIGFFVNTLALRCKINPSQTLLDFVLHIGDKINEAQNYQDLPFEKLVDMLEVEKNTSRNPIFQTMINYKSYNHNQYINESNLFDSFDLEHELVNTIAKFDLTLLIQDTGKELECSFNYATSILEESSIQNFIKTYITLLEQFTLSNIQNDNFSLFNLSYFTKKDYDSYITKLNSNQLELPPSKTIVEQFEKQVEHTPDNIAIVYEDISLSYNDLNNTANRIANYLLDNFVINSDNFIGLLLKKSEKMIISMLSILKSGAAYVPISPESPKDRINYIIDDTDIKIIICNYETKHLLPHNDNLTAICIEDLINEMSVDLPFTNPQTYIKENNLCYVIYTSGTTGNPKGVMVEHKNAMNYAYAQALYTKLLPVGNNYKKSLFFSNYVFDAHVLDIYPGLLNGHTIYVLKEELMKDLIGLNDYIKKNDIDISMITPALLNTKNLLELKTLMVGGDVTNEEIIKEYLQKGISVINLYGPTETTVVISQHKYSEGDINTNIGKPIPNTAIYIIDKYNRLLPKGAIGELLASGIGVSRGYLNKSELTNKSFIQNPFNQNIEIFNRSYKTGDVGRYMENGDIEFLNRNDRQVKLRGYRIELGEIESQLLNIDQIKQAAVVVKELNSKQLVAYYVCDDFLEETYIISRIEKNLPHYMIPSHFIKLDSIPTNLNGKLDVKSLPVPIFYNNSKYIVPENDLQNRLVKIFADILDLDKNSISIDADFFKLGGDSISSMQLVSRISQELKLKVAIKDIFIYKTIRNISNNIGNKSKTDIINETGLLEGEFDLLPIQHWFFNNVTNKSLMNYNHWNQAFSFNIPKMKKSTLKTIIIKLIEFHDLLRVTYHLDKGKEIFCQRYSDILTEPQIGYLNASNLTNEELEEELTKWQNHFDIYNGPLFNVGIISYDDNIYDTLHFSAHHLIIDAVSWRIIKDDIQRLFDYYSSVDFNFEIFKGTPVESVLGEKYTSYRQWVDVINSYRKNHPNEEEYWLNYIPKIEKENILLQTLFVDKPSTFAITIDECNLTFAQQINEQYKFSIHDLLLSSLCLSLPTLTGLKNNCILAEGHGREEITDNINISRTVGWFTSMYPLELNAEVDNLSELVFNISKIREIIPNNGIGYGALLGYNTIPSIAFNYLGQFDNNKTENSGTWDFSNHALGRVIGNNNSEYFKITINALILNKKLEINFSGLIESNDLTKFALIFEVNFQKILLSLASNNLKNNYTDQNLLQQDTIKFENNSFKQIVKQNDVNSKKDLFLIHPAAGGCEVYNSLSMGISNVNCYGIDSYNLYNPGHLIHDLNKLAQHYLDYILKTSISDEINILGWSLGGVIALEIASILESKGFKKINIFLLDTFINNGDPKLIELKNELLSDESYYKQTDKKHEYNSNQILPYLKSEHDITIQDISSKLEHTQIILFRALQKYDKFSEEFNNHIKQLTYYNLENISNLNNIEIYNLDEIHHGNILDEEEFIINILNEKIIRS